MGLFNRAEAITGMVLDDQPAIHAYHSEMLVWDGTRQAFVSVTRTVATTTARTPVVTADSVPDTAPAREVNAAVLTPVLSATAIADPEVVEITALCVVPVVSADSLILAEVITCATQALPAEAAEANDGNVSAVPAVVDAQAVSPAVDSSVTTLPPTIVASADVPTPVVTVTGSGTVDAVVAAVSAQAGTPTLSAAGRVTALVATGSASAGTPVLGGGATITAVTATGTASGHAPIVSGGMNSQGMQRTTAALTIAQSTYTKLTPMQAKSGYESTIVSDGLVMPGGGVCNLAAQVTWNSSSASERRLRIVKNGSTVLGETVSSGTHSVITVSVSSVTLVSSDVLTLEGYAVSGTSSARALETTAAVTYLTVTVP
ncbi:hypothetical protein [Rhodococcus jostii]|uniref:hypothetical protein n=1 Tax=Rhodococcus jostii TaxID=132919 RepID=UPI003629A805